LLTDILKYYENLFYRNNKLIEFFLLEIEFCY
jgi:hypothetical protein